MRAVLRYLARGRNPVAAVVAAAGLGLLTTLAGCGGDGSGGSGGGGGGSGGQFNRYVYESAYQRSSAGVVTGGIYGYQFDPQVGTLTPLAGSPFPLVHVDAPIVLSRDDRFLYLGKSDGVTAYAVQAGGNLVPVSGSPFAASGPVGVVVSNPAMDYLYATTSQGNVIVYAIDPSSGALTEQSTAPVTGFAPPLAFTPDGRFVYSLESAPEGPHVLGFAVDQASGALQALPTGPAVIPDPMGMFSYYDAAMDPLGRFIYITNSAQWTGVGGAMVGISIDSKSGALGVPAFISPSDGSSQSMAIDSTGTFATVDTPPSAQAAVQNCFSVARIDTTTGNLTAVSGSPFSTAKSGISCGKLAADFSAPYVYDEVSNGLYVYLLDKTTGAPKLVDHAAHPDQLVNNVVVTH